MRRRPFSPGPDFMVLTFVGSLLTTSLAGLVTETLLDKSAQALTLEERVARETQALLAGLGWQEPTDAAVCGPADLLARHSGAQLLVAARPFSLPLPTGLLEGGAPAEGATPAARVVAEELARYPEGFLDSAGLERVVLCAGLREAGEPIPSLPNYRATLLIDVDAPAPFLRRLVHHEVFHFLDFADDLHVTSDAEWSMLNEPGFRYGAGGRSVRDPAASLLTSDMPGFLTRYATAAVEEDKAELFAFLMTAPREVGRRAERDAVLGKKVALLEARLGDSFEGLGAGLW